MATLTAREEDYLETIYRLSSEDHLVGVTEVAKARGVTVPTARSAVARLVKYGLVTKEYYGKIVLEPEGRKLAEQVYAVHKVLLRFLKDVLLMEREAAEKEACRMEHGLSKNTLRRLVLFLEAVEKCSGSQPGCLGMYRQAVSEQDLEWKAM
jgi:DtxR family Mn-dependent transcriptional regulator